MWSCLSDTPRRLLVLPFLTTFLEKCKKLPRKPRATWSGIVRKACLQNPSDLKNFCPCLYLWNHCITLSYSTMPLLSPKSGMAAVCRCLCELHSGHTFCTSQKLLVEPHNFFWFTAPISGCFSLLCSCADDCSCLSTKLIPNDFFLIYFSFQINSTTQECLDFFQTCFHIQMCLQFPSASYKV